MLSIHTSWTMWREKFLSTKGHLAKTEIKAGVTKGETGHQLVQPPGHVRSFVGHVRDSCPVAKHGRYVLQGGWTAVVRAADGEINPGSLWAQGLPVIIPSME